jgi:hypothetical protein
MRVGIDAIGGIGDTTGDTSAFGKVRVVTPTTNIGMQGNNSSGLIGAPKPTRRNVWNSENMFWA